MHILYSLVKKVFKPFPKLLVFLAVVRKRFFGASLTVFLTEDEIIRSVLGRCVRPFVIDVGAHRGESVVRFQSLLPGSVIHAFEPIPRNFAALQIHSGENCSLFASAVSDNNSKVDVLEYAKSDTSSILPPNLESGWAKRRADEHSFGDVKKLVVRSHQVPTITLDTLLRGNASRVDVLKIDTQGSEEKVLRGAKLLLASPERRPKIVLVEVILGSPYQHKFSFYSIERFLVPQGYRLVRISSGGDIYTNDAFQVDALYIHELELPSVHLFGA